MSSSAYVPVWVTSGALEPHNIVGHVTAIHIYRTISVTLCLVVGDYQILRAGSILMLFIGRSYTLSTFVVFYFFSIFTVYGFHGFVMLWSSYWWNVDHSLIALHCQRFMIILIITINIILKFDFKLIKSRILEKKYLHTVYYVPKKTDKTFSIIKWGQLHLHSVLQIKEKIRISNKTCQFDIV